ncbi:hypothetical protein D3C86_1987760 [compost metagenome]
MSDRRFQSAACLAGAFGVTGAVAARKRRSGIEAGFGGNIGKARSGLDHLSTSGVEAECEIVGMRRDTHRLVKEILKVADADARSSGKF